ncbi:MAG: YcjF family protein [Oceanipulchritudo sp.]
MSKPPPTRTQRPEDSGYNNPSRQPAKTRKVAEEPAPDVSELELNPVMNADARGPAALRILNRIRRFFRVSVAVLILTVLLVGLGIYAAALDFLIRIHAYPIYLQWPVWLLLGLVLVLVLYAVIRLLLVWRTLHRHPQVSLEKVELSDRVAARSQLTDYLKALLKQPADRWRKVWPDEEAASQVSEACRNLVRERHIDADSWLDEYERQVRSPMDQAATARIRSYWQLVGVKTAISPFPLIDAMAVLYNNFLMIGDLATLYGRRIRRHEIVILLWVVFFQVYVASQSQELLDSAADEMGQTIHSGIARSFTHFISPKLAEGTIHAMVTWRIGKRAMRMMQPVTRN